MTATRKAILILGALAGFVALSAARSQSHAPKIEPAALRSNTARVTGT